MTELQTHSATPFHSAFGLVSRMTVPIKGAVPFVSYGACVCVHPNGVFATAFHVVENMISRFSPYGPEECAEISRTEGDIPVEEHEQPHVLLPWTRRRRSWDGVPMHGLAIHRLNGNKHTDAAAICVSPTDDFLPFPYLQATRTAPKIGQKVRYLGHSRPDFVSNDEFGYPAGMAIEHNGAEVVALHNEGFLLEFEAEPGMSGGPVVDSSSGQLLGIISGVWSARTAQQEVGLDRRLTYVVGTSTCIPHIGAVLRAEGWL